MQIRTATFVESAASPKQFLKRPIPHFVFAGKSNVGKSSILNKLLNRKALAKTSQTPGKTRLVNYFLINDNLFFVDLPGYGFAKVSKSERESWGKLIESYLQETPYIAIIFLLVDIRHEPTANDLQMLHWLRHFNYPFKILLTKSDKLSRNQCAKQHFAIAKICEMDKSDLIVTSSIDGTGAKQVWTLINDAYEAGKNRIFEP